MRVEHLEKTMKIQDEIDRFGPRVRQIRAHSISGKEKGIRAVKRFLSSLDHISVRGSLPTYHLVYGNSGQFEKVPSSVLMDYSISVCLLEKTDLGRGLFV